MEEHVTSLDLEAESGFHWLPFDKLELQIYNIRHIQQHTGELYERLGTAGGVELGWVGMKPDRGDLMEPEGGIIVGILGQWASGKSTAAGTLVGYLGGEDKVAFITDRDLFAGQAVKYLLELEDSQVTSTLEDDGTRRLEGEYAAVWLGPGEDLKSVDLSTLRWSLHEDVIPAWLNRARVEVGHQIRERSADGKPIVIEAGFGKHPIDHTISDLFIALEEAGVEPKQVKWIIVEAGFDKRSERNEKRRLDVLTPVHQLICLPDMLLMAAI